MLEEFPIRASGVHAGASCSILRRDKFKDPRVRLALNYAFDFEEMNKQLFFGQYKRIGSYFEGTELASLGPAARARNWKSSKPCATRCRAEVFTKPYTNPVGGSPENVRAQSARGDRGC